MSIKKLLKIHIIIFADPAHIAGSDWYNQRYWNWLPMTSENIPVTSFQLHDYK
jgi:hypothetical protein